MLLRDGPDTLLEELERVYWSVNVGTAIFQKDVTESLLTLT